MNEVSTTVDGGENSAASSEVEETGEDQIDSSQEVNSEENSEVNSEEGSKEKTQESTQYTEKGTKLDSNPQSAVHQQLANERRVRADYERVLNSPELLRNYAKRSGMSLTEAKAEVKQEKRTYSSEGFKTAEDVATAFNSVSQELKALKVENQRLTGRLGGFSKMNRVERVQNTIKQDISTVQAKYPELNPKNSSYDPDLEANIAELYQELDFDSKTGGYRGNCSIAKLTDRIMRAAKTARKQGSKQAQTNVKVKQAGKIVTSGKSKSKKTTGSTDPGTAIAQKIQKAMGR